MSQVELIFCFCYPSAFLIAESFSFFLLCLFLFLQQYGLLACLTVLTCQVKCAAPPDVVVVLIAKFVPSVC